MKRGVRRVKKVNPETVRQFREFLEFLLAMHERPNKTLKKKVK